MSKNADLDVCRCPYRAKPIGSLSVSGLSGVPRLANRCAMIIYIRNSCQAFALKFLIKYNVFLVLRRFIFQKCPKMAKNGVFYTVIYCRLYPQKTPIFSIILPIIRCHTTGNNTPILRLSDYLLLALMIVPYY